MENKKVIKNKKIFPELKKVNTLSTKDNSRLINISDLILIAGIKRPRDKSNSASVSKKPIHLSEFIN
jgi:hypothetical protein